MSDDDTRSSGGGPLGPQEDDKSPAAQTDLEAALGSPCSAGGGGSSHRPTSPVNGSLSPRPLLDIHKGRPIRLQVRVLVPIKDHPNYNFVGKLLGPKGNSLKRLQEETQTKMAILGRGSMRDREREEELRATGDPKHNHLREDLHVEVTAFAPAAEAYARMAHALAEVKRFLVPDYYDDIRQNQLRELAVLNGNRKRVGKGLPVDEQDYDEAQDTPLRPNFTPTLHQQRLQVNGGCQQQHGPSPPSLQQQQQQGGGAPRPLRCGLVSRGAPLLGRTMRAAAPRRHHQGSPPGLVRSFVTSVCARSAGSLFREVTLGAPGAAPAEAARIQYLTEEDAFALENGFPCGGDPQRADDFELRPSPAYVGHEYVDDDDAADAIYEPHNGYSAAKDFIGEDWPQQAKGSPVQSPAAPGGRAGPSAGRLKGLPGGPSPVRPTRAIYREHPYFTAAAVARY